MANRRHERLIDRTARRGMRTPPIPRDGETTVPAGGAAFTETETEASQDTGLSIENLAVLESEGPATRSVNETLREGVSIEALLSTSEAHSPDEPAMEKTEATDPAFHAAPVSSASQADEPSSGSVPAPEPPPVEPAPSQADAGETETAQISLPDPASPDRPEAPASLLPAEFETAIAAAAPVAPESKRIIVELALTEIRAANDTVMTYVRNEGIATVAHWQALATAKTPADAIRLHVTEMQRAADASLSCIVSLTRRAGRIAATVHRA